MMDLDATVSLIALTLGVGWASGINLYAATLALGVAGLTGYADLPACSHMRPSKHLASLP